MKLNRIIAASCGAMLMLSNSLSASAATQMDRRSEATEGLTSIIANQIYAEPGETVYYGINVYQNTGFSASGFLLQYDSRLEPVMNQHGTVEKRNGDLGAIVLSVINPKMNQIAFGTESSEQLPKDGEICSFAFKVPNYAKAGDIFTMRLTVDECVDYKTNAVPYTVLNGWIMIPKETTTTTRTVTTTAKTTLTTTTIATTTTTKQELPTLEKDTVNLCVGEKHSLEKFNAYQVTYKTSNTDVAVVSKNGIITAIGTGKAIISVIDPDGNVQQLTVFVTEQTTSTTSNTTATVKTTTNATTTETTTTTSTTSTAKPTTTTTTTSTTKPTTTTITTTATTTKSSIISATTTAISTTTTVETIPALQIDNTKVSLTNGNQYTIQSNRNDVTYKTNNPDVAIVSPQGVITAVGVGQATITAFDTDSNVIQIKVEITAVTTITTENSTSEAITSTSELTTTETEYLLGDVNSDNTISVEDAQLTLIEYVNTMSGLESGFSAKQKLAGDINGDKEISVEDAQNILIYYVSNTLSGQNVTWDELLGKKPPANPLPVLLKRKERILFEPKWFRLKPGP